MPVEVLLIGHDITETIKYSQRIKQTNELLEKKNRELEQSNSELASFSYVASHDLQEPLRKIRMFGKMIVDQESETLSENGRDYLKRMVNASNRMQKLIEALLEFSRTNTAARNFEKTDLNVLMEEVLKELNERIKESKARITIEKLPTLYVIPFQFNQMFVNIVGNSIKYAKEGVTPEIHISSEMISAEKLDHPDVVVGMDYCCISVTDNGIGFEPQYSEKVFELFQRLHGRNEYAGSGIGLAICKKIAKNHNGLFHSRGKHPGCRHYDQGIHTLLTCVCAISFLK
jgi:light-regulated signal transduction histidine kinase (bacteriophytochrome)